jgi:hypothetical protein
MKDYDHNVIILNIKLLEVMSNEYLTKLTKIMRGESEKSNEYNKKR